MWELITQGPITQSGTKVCSVGKYSRFSQKERGEVSWVEENVPTPVSLNKISIRVDRDEMYMDCRGRQPRMCEVPQVCSLWAGILGWQH